jgi:uncharacterized protein
MLESHQTRLTALVTGASSGIGRAFAELLAEEGFDVVAIARREDRLLKLKGELEGRFGIKVYVLRSDLADPESPKRIYDSVAQLGIKVDFLVNNAGFAIFGRFLDSDWRKQKEFMQVVLTTPLEMTYLFGKDMKERGSGWIINVCSAAALWHGVPLQALYPGAKSALAKFTQGFSLENREFGIKATCSCPGWTRTEIFENTGIAEQVERSMPSFAYQLPDVVAREAYDACLKGRVLIVHGTLSKMLVLLSRALPSYLVTSLFFALTKRFDAP